MASRRRASTAIRAQPRTPTPNRTSYDHRPPAPRTTAALAARRQKTGAALQRVHDAIARLRREKAQVSVAAVARRADVSRTFLYDNPDARAASLRR
ncbi:DUF6262 family protein [Streptomyces sp. NRRL F-5122]|uniref:DUF6262 family protein n=1 Tax=Streptomyces sp. NRRL F-5122 TaxID=1609098 RepID=UPI0022770D7D|nr:DUF6262 family protein [Streptomyces sp. NRRL F-5122]